jgi:N-formylglutamate deformylase
VVPFLELPARSPELPIIASVPHSGTFVPAWLEPKFAPAALEALPNSDWFLGQLYDFLPRLGVSMIVATHSRYVGDLNRPEQLAYGDFWKAMVPEKTANGRSVYRVAPTDSELLRMRDEHHRPYHRRLATQLSDVQSRWGRAYLLDLHSFFGLIEADVCLGNGSGTTCTEPLLRAFERGFQALDFATVRNRVFTGGYITRHYAALPQVETLQIELRYTCYHDCSHIDEPVRPVPDPARLSSARQRLERVFEQALEHLLVGIESPAGA